MEARLIQEWECFRDLAYYDMWCVRKVGERRFEFGYHVSSEAEARALCEEMTTLAAELARERERHQDLRQVVKEYREQHYDDGLECAFMVSDDDGVKTDYRCAICRKLDLLLEPQPAPVATGETE